MRGVGGGRMTTTAIATAMIRGQRQRRSDGGGGDGRGGIIVPHPCPAPPSHAGRATPPCIVVVRCAPATSPSAVDRVALLILLIIVARRRKTLSNDVVVAYSKLGFFNLIIDLFHYFTFPQLNPPDLNAPIMIK